MLNKKMMLLLAALVSWLPAAAADKPLPDSSLYQMQTSWQKDNGDTVQLRNLRGQVQVLSLFFTQCNGICPMIVSQIKSIRKDLPPRLQGQVGFTLVTLDPTEDSLPVLRAYRKKMGLTSSDWELLRGNLDDTRELANLLGVDIGSESDGQIPHTALIVILDRNGRIKGSFPGISDQKVFMRQLEAAERQG